MRGEVLPALTRNPQYLARNDMALVSGAGDDAPPIPASADNIARLARGICLHDTPAQQLFGRPRRDFSHGCVRLENPLALAIWALQDQPQWSRQRIVAAMNGPRSSKRWRAAGCPEEVVAAYQARTGPVSTCTKPEAG